MSNIAPTKKERLCSVREALKPLGYTIRKTNTIGMWVIEHPATKRKVRFYPGTGRWTVWFNDLHPKGLLIPKDMPRGIGVESLCERLITEIQPQPQLAA